MQLYSCQHEVNIMKLFWCPGCLYLCYTFSWYHAVTICNCNHAVAIVQLLSCNCYYAIAIMQLLLCNWYYATAIMLLLLCYCYYATAVMQLLLCSYFYSTAIMQLLLCNCCSYWCCYCCRRFCCRCHQNCNRHQPGLARLSCYFQIKLDFHPG